MGVVGVPRELRNKEPNRNQDRKWNQERNGNKTREKIKLLIARSIGIRKASRLLNMLFCRINLRTM